MAEKQHNFSINCPNDFILLGQRSELYSALSNLVINAAKYTPASGMIELRAALDSTGVKIEVEDNGLGIESHHIPRLTERFYRVDPSRSAESGGTGLGLAIVKHILARHDSELEVKSTPRKGSVFGCHIPRERVLD